MKTTVEVAKELGVVVPTIRRRIYKILEEQPKMEKYFKKFGRDWFIEPEGVEALKDAPDGRKGKWVKTKIG